MEIFRRENEYGYTDYYDWEMNDKETVLVHVLQVCLNRQGKPYIKAEYEGLKFYANISPHDADKLEDNGWYDMTCTGHTGQIKWLTFNPALQPQLKIEECLTELKLPKLSEEGYNSNPFPTTPNIPTSATDKDSDEWLHEQKNDLLRRRQVIDQELGRINNIIGRINY